MSSKPFRHSPALSSKSAVLSEYSRAQVQHPFSFNTAASIDSSIRDPPFSPALGSIGKYIYTCKSQFFTPQNKTKQNKSAQNKNKGKAKQYATKFSAFFFCLGARINHHHSSFFFVQFFQCGE